MQTSRHVCSPAIHQKRGVSSGLVAKWFAGRSGEGCGSRVGEKTEGTG